MQLCSNFPFRVMQLKAWKDESLLYHSCSLARDRTFYNSRKNKNVGVKLNIDFSKEPCHLLLSHPGHGSLMINLAFVSTCEASRLIKPMLSPDWISWTSTTSPLPVGRERMSNTTGRKLSLLFTIATSAQTQHFK